MVDNFGNDGRRRSTRVKNLNSSFSKDDKVNVNHKRDIQNSSLRRSTRVSNSRTSFEHYFQDKEIFEESRDNFERLRKVGSRGSNTKLGRSDIKKSEIYSEEDSSSDPSRDGDTSEEGEERTNSNKSYKRGRSTVDTKKKSSDEEDRSDEMKVDGESSSQENAAKRTRSQNLSTTSKKVESDYDDSIEGSSSDKVSSGPRRSLRSSTVNKSIISDEKEDGISTHEEESTSDEIVMQPSQSNRLNKQAILQSSDGDEKFEVPKDSLFDDDIDSNVKSPDLNKLPVLVEEEAEVLDKVEKVTVNVTSMVKFDNVDSSSDDSDNEDGLKTNGRVSKNLLPMNATQLLPYRTELNVKDQSNLPSLELPVNQIGYPTFETQLQEVIQSITLPLQHSEICNNFKIKSCPGLLLYGPPGTGKTTFARHLAHLFTYHSEFKVAYFHMNSSDLLSKNTGESERNLVKVFHSMRKWAPSILFIDEIDGLIPVRNDKDRPSASLVATFLTLMDGILPNSSITVIGATNRPDSIDPAFRRPGRFSQEYHFKLPNLDTRQQILRSLTHTWPNFRPEPELLERLGYCTNGFSNADLKALTNQAAVKALNRNYPNLITKLGSAVQTNVYNDLEVTGDDFNHALQDLKPSATRSKLRPTTDLPQHFHPLLDYKVTEMLHLLEEYFTKYDPTDEGPRQYRNTAILLKARGPISANYILSQLTSKLVDTEVTYLDPLRNATESDRSAITHMQIKFDISKSRSTNLIVVRDIARLTSDPRWALAWNYLKWKINQPNIQGKLGVLLLTDDSKPIPTGQNWYKLDGDRFNSNAFQPFLNRILSLQFTTSNLNHQLLQPKLNNLQAKLSNLDNDIIVKKLGVLNQVRDDEFTNVTHFIDKLILLLGRDETNKNVFKF